MNKILIILTIFSSIIFAENINKEKNILNKKEFVKGYINNPLIIEKDNDFYFIKNIENVEIKDNDKINSCIINEISLEDITIICSTNKAKTFIFKTGSYKKDKNELLIDMPYFYGFIIKPDLMIKN